MSRSRHTGKPRRRVKLRPDAGVHLVKSWGHTEKIRRRNRQLFARRFSKLKRAAFASLDRECLTELPAPEREWQR